MELSKKQFSERVAFFCTLAILAIIVTAVISSCKARTTVDIKGTNKRTQGNSYYKK